MIGKDTIEEIFEAAQIDEVVGEFVNLKKRGVNLIGLCPFHNEKTPSFTVSPKKGIYKCFGCGKGGNSVQFLMDHEQFTYPEALKYLAKKYNIEIEEKEQTPEEIKQLNEKESLYHVTDFAAKYFASKLFGSEQGKAIGLSYFKERGFREDIIKKFQLGYTIDEWDNFTSHAIKNGYNIDYLEKTGLTIVRENKTYDRFRGRVMFPIQNLSGRVLGFGGRTLSIDPKSPKYVNSPESDIYHKSKVLYGINHAKNSIITNDNCFLVEGYTDVISLHMAGVENVVSSSGTSLTTDQIRLISRYTKNISILYDGDAAGIKASFRGIDMILEQGMDVKIVLFPEGEDPDSFARSHRSTEVQDFIKEEAHNFIFFKTNLLIKDAENDPVKKVGLIKEIVATIALIPDQITRSVYVKECSALLDITEETLLNELNKIRRKNFDKKLKEKSRGQDAPVSTEPHIFEAEKQQAPTDYLSSEYQEKDVIRLLMSYGNHEVINEYTDDEGNEQEEEVDVASFIISDLLNDEIPFRNSLYQRIFDVVTHEINNENIPDEKFFLNHSDQDIAALAANLLISKYELNDWDRVKITVHGEEDKLKLAIEHSVLSMKLRWLEGKFDETIKALQNASDENDVELLLNSQKKLIHKKSAISARLGRIVLR